MFKRTVLIDLLLIFVLSLTPLLWFRPGEMMVGHDNIFPLNPFEFFQGRLFTWSNQGLGYDQSTIMGTIPIHLIDLLPFLSGFSLQTTQKIVYVFWFFMIGLSVYILASMINRESRVFKLTSVILYQFNFFVLQGWWVGERTKFSALIALPLVLSVFILLSRQKINPFKAAIASALILSFFNGGGLFGLALFGGLLVSLTVFIIFVSFWAWQQRKYGLIKNMFLTLVLTVLFWALLNAYFLLPPLNSFLIKYQTEVGQSGGLSGFVNWANEISLSSSFLNLFRLQGMADWYSNPEHPYAQTFLNNPYFIALSFLWPILVFSSLIFVRQEKKRVFILYFFLIYLVGIFFTAGTHPPLGFIYSFLMKFIPGFAIFRSPYYKFAPAIFLANAILVAFFIDHFKGFFKKFLFISFLLIWLSYYFPYFRGNFFEWQKGLSTRLKIPSYIFDFFDWVNYEKQDGGRILLLPPNNYDWQFDTYRWGYLSSFPLPRLGTQESILVNDINLTEIENRLLQLAYKSFLEKDEDFFRKIASHLGIKYLLLRNDVFWDLDWVKSEPPFSYQEALQDFSSVQHLKSFGEWDLYEVDNARPSFYATSQLSYLDLPAKKIGNYYSLNLETFFMKTDNPSGLREILSSLTGTAYIQAECASCRHEKTPDFVLPETLILPDSPFYFSIRLKEKMGLKETDPKIAVYDYLGLSLKRLAEIRKFIFQRKAGQSLASERFLLYNQTLSQIGKLFNQIGDFENQYEVAFNLDFYLQNEEKHLRNLLGEWVVNEEEVKLFEETFALISSLRKELTPYLFEKDLEKNKLYTFVVDKPDDWQLLLNKKSAEGALIDSGEIKTVIDDKIEKVINLGSVSELPDWLDLGVMNFSDGGHSLVLTLPRAENLASDFEKDNVKIKTQSDKCFAANIKGFDNRKTYKMKFNYQGGLSDDFSTYVTKRVGEEVFRQVQKIEQINLGVNQEEIIYPDKTAEERKIGFCDTNLSLDLLQEKISLEVYEIIHPEILLVSAGEKAPFINPSITFQKINPTKYLIEVKNAHQPFVLVFREAFDPEWKLKGDFVKNHFTINGYANGWIIDKEGDYGFMVEYAPQRIFYLGELITILSLFGSLCLVLKR